MVYGVPHSRLYPPTRQIHKKRARGRRIEKEKYRNTFAWFSAYVADAAQPDPRKCELHLSRSIPKRVLWHHMCQECRGPVYSYPEFLVFLRMHFPNVKWPRKNRLGRCNTCVQLKDAIEKAKTKKNRQQLKALLSTHNEWQEGQRQEYYNRAADAARHPNEMLSITMDTADAFLMPQHHPPPKSWFRKYIYLFIVIFVLLINL
jgi:hypothetical protein